MAMKFLSMGYHAFVLRYSVYSKGGFDEIDYKKPLHGFSNVLHIRFLKKCNGYNDGRDTKTTITAGVASCFKPDYRGGKERENP